MKKIVTLLVATCLIFSVSAQENDLKNFRFGLKLEPSVNWLKVDNEKKFENLGSTFGFGFGAQMEFRLSDNYAIVTGFGLRYDKGNIGFLSASSADSTYYMLNKDEEFLEIGSSWPLILGSDTSGNMLKERKYNISYINIPLALKMRTKEIGYMRYFGQFGFDLGIKTKTRVDDVVYINGSATESTITDLNLDKGTQLMRVGLNVGAGLEYTISGNTAILAGVHFHMAFSNTLKSEDDYLRKDNGSGSPVAIEQNAQARGLYFTVGVLF